MNQTFYVRHIQATNNISLLFLLVIINKKYLNVCIAFRKRYFNKLLLVAYNLKHGAVFKIFGLIQTITD